MAIKFGPREHMTRHVSRVVCEFVWVRVIPAQHQQQQQPTQPAR